MEMINLDKTCITGRIDKLASMPDQIVDSRPLGGYLLIDVLSPMLLVVQIGEIDLSPLRIVIVDIGN